jgi:cytochrome c oxidase subunit 2
MGGSLLLASSEATQRLSIFDPASPSAESIRNNSILVLAICAFIFVVVEGVLFYSIIRFRRKAGASGEPPQVYGSKPVEIAWTVAPAMIVFILVLVCARTLWEVQPPPPEPKKGDRALFVTVIGRQWWWQYNYDRYDGEELGFTTANELHIPASEDGERPVNLTLKSADVCHSFWVPRLHGKMDLIPGRSNFLTFRTDKPGLFVGQCAEYCGTQHAKMLLRVVVDSPKDFDAWLEHQKTPASAEASEDKALFLRKSCVNCHRVRGTETKDVYAPDLTHLMSRQTLASGIIPNTPEQLRAWVTNPQKIKPGCLMPAFGLTKQELDSVMNYLLTLK